MARINSNWFEFKGINSADIGVALRDAHAFSVAEDRGEALEICGRDGDTWVAEDGAKSFDLKRVCRVRASRMRGVAAWLTGSGKLRFSSEPNVAYEACIRRRVDFKLAVPGTDPIYEFSVTFTCQPHPFVWPIQSSLTFTEDSVFAGQGNAEALPVITVAGGGDINLMVNAQTVLIDNLKGSITLDCEARTAYTVDKSGRWSFAGRQVTLMGDWPRLLPEGESTNRIAFSGDVTKVEIEPWWRWY